MAFALCSVAFTSCGDDDEGGPTPQGPTTTFAGKLPTQVGSYTFHYDDNGRCTRVSSSYSDVLEIDYKRNIIMTDGEDDYMNITFNSKGYITKMSGSWNYSEGGEYEKGSGTVTFKYDGDGHLTTYSGTSKESYSFDGEKYSYTGYGNVSCTWRGGNLVSAEYTYEETENEFGNRIGVRPGGVHYVDIVLAGVLDVDGVEAGAGADDQLELRQLIDDLRSDLLAADDQHFRVTVGFDEIGERRGCVEHHLIAAFGEKLGGKLV